MLDVKPLHGERSGNNKGSTLSCLHFFLGEMITELKWSSLLALVALSTILGVIYVFI